jgi:hypothetical protein
MTKTYGSHLERVFDALVNEAIADEKSVLEAGNLASFDEYRNRTGYIRGLRTALELLDEAEYFVRTGKRRGEED